MLKGLLPGIFYTGEKNMSLLDDINTRISQLQAATDANYKAAGYTIPTSSQRKIAELSGQNPYEYATSLAAIEQQQKEAEKAAKTAQKAAQKTSKVSSSSSSKKTSTSSTSSSTVSTSGDDAPSSISSLFESEEENNTIPSIKDVHDIDQEAFQRRRARRQQRKAEYTAANATQKSNTGLKNSNNLSNTGTTNNKTLVVNNKLNNYEESEKVNESESTEKTSKSKTSKVKTDVPDLFPQGSMEKELYNLRNAEMAGLKAKQDYEENTNNLVDQYRKEAADKGVDLDAELAKMNDYTGENKTIEELAVELDKEKHPENYESKNSSNTPIVKIDSTNVSDYVDSKRQLTSSEEEAAKAYIEQYKEDHKGFEDTIKLIDDATNQVARINKANGTNYTLNDYLEANGVSIEEYQEARNVEALEKKISNTAAYTSGLTDKAYNISQIPSIVGDKLTNGMEQGYNEQDKMSEYYSDLDKYRQESIRESQQTQSPIAYGAGKATEMAASTMLANGILNGSELVDTVASMAGGSKLAKDLSAIGLDTLLVDIPTDTIPEMIANYNSGMPLNEVLKNAGINVAGNMAINALMDVALPNYVDNLGKNKLEAAEKEAAEYAENLGKTTPFDLSDENIDALIPSLKGADQVVDAGVNIPSLIKQQEDAVQNIDSLAKQIPQNDVDNISTKVYDESVNNVDSTLRGNENGTAVNRTGNQGNIRSEESGAILSGASREVSQEGIFRPENSDNAYRTVVTDDMRAKMNDAGVNDVGLRDYTNDYNFYSQALSEAKKANEYGAFVDAQSVEALKDNNAKVFMSENGGCGVAVKDNGNIVGVFKNTDKYPDKTIAKGAAKDELITARLNGGDRLDCYGSDLVDMYSPVGFEPTHKVKYEYGINDEMDTWCKAQKAKDPNFDEPDIIFMKVRNGESVEDTLRLLKENQIPDYEETIANMPYTEGKNGLTAYDVAEMERNALIDGAPKQGAFFDGENIPNTAKTNVDIPAENTKVNNSGITDNPDMRQRGYDKTYQSGRTNIQEGLKTEPEMYKVRHNADTQKAADEIWNASKSLDATETKARSLIAEGDATAVPLTSKLINEYARTGDTNKAVDLLNALEEKMTKSGQFTQAAKMTIVQNNPEVAKTYLQRQIDALNTAGKSKFKNRWVDFKLTEDEIKAFSNINPGDVDAISDLYTQIGKRLGQEMPVSFSDKLNEYRKLNMLFNPRTHIRNVAANTVMLPVREATDRVSAIGQNIYKLFHRDYEVTQSILSPSASDRKLAGTIFDSEIAPRLDGSKYAEQAVGIDAFNKAFNENRQIFRDSKVGGFTNEILFSDNSILNKISGGKIADAVREGKITGSNLENLRRFDYYLLGELEDNPFVKANFDSRLGSYIRAQKITDVANIPSEVIEIAYQEALKATFKDDNVLSDTLGSVRKSLNKYSGNLLGDALFPFTKTPSAIAMRGIDYSPLGLATSIGKYLGSNRSAIDISNLFDDMSKAVTGTAAIALGFELAKEGVITGSLSDNTREKQFEQAQGKQAYSIKIGDRYYSYDWAQPSAIPFILGATIYNAMEEDNAELSNILYGGFEASANAWIDLSPLQTIADVFGSGNYSGSFASGVKDAAISYAGSYIPSVAGATARATDNNYRVSYDNKNMFNAAINQLAAKIPGLSKTLPTSYDMWGRERLRSENGAEAAFAQFVNPGQLSVSNPSPIDNEIQRLHDSTGENTVYPNKASWSVDLGNGETKRLTNEEYSEYSREMGQRSYELADNFIENNEYYDSLNDANKAEVLSSIYSLAKAQSESTLFGKTISENTTNYKLNQLYEEGGSEAVIDYLTTNAVIRQTGADPSDTTRDVFENGIELANGQTVTGVDAVSLYKEANDWLKENDIAVTQKSKQEYYNGNTSGLTQKKEDTETMEKYDLEYNESNTKILDSYGEEGLQAKQILKDSGYSFDDYEKNLYETGGIPAIQGYVNSMNALNSAGLKASNEVYEAYQHATETIPSLTESQYAAAVKKIDDNGDSKVSQTEMLDYFNSGNYSQSDVEQMWDVFGEWKRTPYIKKDGTWGAK